jgi:hypothetical protein
VNSSRQETEKEISNSSSSSSATDDGENSPRIKGAVVPLPMLCLVLATDGVWYVTFHREVYLCLEMSVYMYVYIYIHIYIYIYICTYIYIYVHIYIYTYIFMRIYTYICIHIYIYICYRWSLVKNNVSWTLTVSPSPIFSNITLFWTLFDSFSYLCCNLKSVIMLWLID